MKKTEIKVKENITLQDKANAIEIIADRGFFTDGSYTPYYSEMIEVYAIMNYFLEGFDLEDGEDYFELSVKDKDLNKAVRMFYPQDETYIKKLSAKDRTLHQNCENTMQFVMQNVFEMVSFQKQLIVAQVTSGNNALIEEKMMELLDMERIKIEQEMVINEDTAIFAKSMASIENALTEEEQIALYKNMAKSDFSFDADNIANAFSNKLFDSELHKEKELLLEENRALKDNVDILQEAYAKEKVKEEGRNVVADKPKRGRKPKGISVVK